MICEWHLNFKLIDTEVHHVQPKANFLLGHGIVEVKYNLPVLSPIILQQVSVLAQKFQLRNRD